MTQDIAHACAIVVEILRTRGAATNTQIARAIGDDHRLFQEVREELILADLAADKAGVGLVCVEQAAGPPPAGSRREWQASLAPHSRDGARIFLSYAHADAAAFVTRLRTDLESCGYVVWHDRDMTTGAWDTQLEDAIDGVDLLLAVLTPMAVRSRSASGHAGRDDSVCLDEISRARYRAKIPIVPVMVLDCVPPFPIDRLHYTDFSKWQDEARYRSAFGHLLEAIQSAVRGDPPKFRHLLPDIVPLDFSAFLDEAHHDFCGRGWLFAAIENWRTSDGNRVLLLEGPPGSGKSAVAAALVLRNYDEQVLAYHCCDQYKTTTLQTAAFVRSIAGMVASRLAEYAAALEDVGVRSVLSEGPCAQDPFLAFDEGVLKHLRRLPAPGNVRYILVDAVDRVKPEPGSLVNLLVTRANQLPEWLRFFVTTRSEPAILDRFRGCAVRISLADPRRSSEVGCDVTDYIRRRLQGHQIARRLAESGQDLTTVVKRLRDRSECNFQYLVEAFNDLERGDRGFGRLDQLPSGLWARYSQFFTDAFPDKSTAARVRSVLEVLVAAGEPVTEPVLERATGLSDGELPQILRGKLSVYLRLVDGGWIVQPEALTRWLTHPEVRGTSCTVSLRRGHARLARTFWAEYLAQPGALSGLALRGLPRHLQGAKHWRRAARVLSDLRFVAAKCGADMTHELLADYKAFLAAAPSATRHQRDARRAVEQFERFVLAQAHVLMASPELIVQQAANEPAGSAPTAAALALLDQDSYSRSWLRWVNKPSAREPCLMTLTGHRKAVNACAYAPGGDMLVSASDDHTLRLWDTDSPHCRTILSGHTESVAGCAFSKDGSVVSASHDGTLRVWDSTGLVRRILQGHRDRVLACACSPTAQHAISGSADGTVRVWDLEHGEEIAILSGHVGTVWACAYSADGSMIASASDDGTIRLWDAHEGRGVRTLAGHARAVRTCAFSPDGRRLVSGALDGSCRVWDLANGGVFLDSLQVDQPEVRSAAWSPDGRWLITGSEDGAKLWDVEARRVVAMFAGRGSGVLACAWSPDGRRVTTAGEDRKVRIWDVAASDEFTGHMGEVRRCVFSPDGRHLATVDREGVLRLWLGETGAASPTLARPELIGVQDLAFSPARPLLAVATAGGVVRALDLTTGRDVVYLATAGATRACAWSPDGERLACGTDDGSVTVIDTRKREIAATLPGSAAVSGCEYAPAGPVLAVRDHHVVTLWDPESGTRVKEFVGHNKPMRAFGWSPLGERFFTASYDGSVRLCDADTGTAEVLLGHRDAVVACAWSPDGRRLVSASLDHTLILWGTASERRVLAGHTDAVLACAFHPDGIHFASGSQDGTLRIWTSAGEVSRFVARSAVTAVAFGPSGLLAAGDAFGTLYVLRLEGCNLGAPVVAGLRLYDHNTAGRDNAPSVVCRWCGRRSRVDTLNVECASGPSPGGDVTCGHCHGLMRLARDVEPRPAPKPAERALGQAPRRLSQPWTRLQVRVQQERFLARHTRSDLDSETNATLKRLVDHALGCERRTLVLAGPAGSGRSTLLATAAARYRARRPGSLVLSLCVGLPGAQDPLPAIRFVQESIEAACDLEPMQAEHPSLDALNACLKQAGNRQPVILILDGVDRLCSHDLLEWAAPGNTPVADADDLGSWLVADLPDGVNALVSLGTGGLLESARARGASILDVPTLSDAECRALARARIASRGDPISDEFVEQLVSSLPTGARIPLYLHAALDESLLYGMHDSRARYVDSLAPTLGGLCVQILDRLERDHGTDIVASACGCLAAAPDGLLDAEIVELLERAEFRSPALQWGRLRAALGRMLPPSSDVPGTDILYIESNAFRDVLAERYLGARKEHAGASSPAWASARATVAQLWDGAAPQELPLDPPPTSIGPSLRGASAIDSPQESTVATPPAHWPGPTARLMINEGERQVSAKIVYYGPGLSGKTTNLQYLYDRIPPGKKGKLISLATDTDRTLYFDFLPFVAGTHWGFRVVLNLFAVSGQVFYDATRPLVLKGVTGIIFVADSQVERMHANIESLENLQNNIKKGEAIDLRDLPWVLQLNKRDLPNAAPVNEMVQALRVDDVPTIEAVASKGSGVRESLKALAALILAPKAKRIPETLSGVNVRTASRQRASPSIRSSSEDAETLPYVTRSTMPPVSAQGVPRPTKSVLDTVVHPSSRTTASRSTTAQEGGTGPAPHPFTTPRQPQAALPVSGSVDPRTFPFLLVQLCRRGATGSLEVDGPPNPNVLYYRRGRVVLDTSNLHKQLATHLMNTGTLTSAQLNAMVGKINAGQPLVKSLVDSGVIALSELRQIATTSAERNLADVIACEGGTFAFRNSVIPARVVDLKLSTEQLVVAAVRRVRDWGFVWRHVGSYDTILAQVGARQRHMPKWTDAIGALLAGLDGATTLREAATLASLDEEDAARLACGLVILGLVRRRDSVASNAVSTVGRSVAPSTPATAAAGGHMDGSPIGPRDPTMHAATTAQSPLGPDFPFVVGGLMTGGNTGTLVVIDDGGRTRELFLHHGAVVFGYSDAPTEQSHPAVAAVLGASVVAHREFRRALDLGLPLTWGLGINSTTYPLWAPLLQPIVELVLAGMLAATRGTYRFLSDQLPSGLAPPECRFSSFSLMRRALDAAGNAAALTPHWLPASAVVPRLKDEASTMPAFGGTRLARLIDGKRSLSELARSSGSEPEEVWRSVLALRFLRVLDENSPG